jgi:hypothetical protein
MASSYLFFRVEGERVGFRGYSGPDGEPPAVKESVKEILEGKIVFLAEWLF